MPLTAYKTFIEQDNILNKYIKKHLENRKNFRMSYNKTDFKSTKKIEENFNKNYKALKDRESDTGIEPIIFEDDNLFAETAAKDLNVTKEFIVENSPDGVFVGKGKVYINKNQGTFF